MSSLWTPGGEHPVDRGQDSSQPESGDEPSAQQPGQPSQEQPSQEQLDEMRRQLLAAPASDVIVQHVMAFYELAALHLSSEQPRLDEARLAIDAVDAVLTGLEGRLGEHEQTIAEALPQLKTAFVEVQGGGED
ncbi:MAG: hypothetical protein U5K30_04025 [Acidimicrobiales bacterium]|nr:hypothetical protein [Acidimicrobiales bacterium]